jgi:hypothetical protein
MKFHLQERKVHPFYKVEKSCGTASGHSGLKAVLKLLLHLYRLPEW